LAAADVTTCRRAEVEQQKLHEQVMQMQKMDAIGQLAGGIAHDFNNLLMVIINHCERMQRDLPPNDPLSRCAEQSLMCANLGASLTRKLLAFSRKQSFQPKVLDIGLLVKDMESMIQRLIGEHIECTIDIVGSKAIKADPVQMEQVIMNLVINARDAMPNGGKLRIEARNVIFNGRSDQNPPGTHSGPYVMLSVTDNGHGMDPALQAKIFEPFFTTKPVGKGTGLGLSTAYGIVRQSGGSIQVISESGKGTTFTVYLPAVFEEIPVYSPSIHDFGRKNAMEARKLILLVDDEPALLETLKLTIETVGFRVRAVGNGIEAVRVVREENLRPDLLLTDIIMPGMNGKVLADLLRKSVPGIKIVYMSGYTDDIIGNTDDIGPDALFLQKPFTMRELVAQISLI
jgi:nitrogen-specific signal transduction histidine kinase